jgi:hypothetical protein
VIIEAYRGSGDRLGDPIDEPMLSDNVLSIRAFSELNANAHPMTKVSLDIPFRQNLKLGMLVSVDDPLRQTPYRGVVRGISISITESSIQTKLDLEVPL